MEFVFLKLTSCGILSWRHQIEFEKQTSSLVLAIKDDMNLDTVFLSAVQTNSPLCYS